MVIIYRDIKPTAHPQTNQQIYHVNNKIIYLPRPQTVAEHQ